jgi:hypothetical protein
MLLKDFIYKNEKQNYIIRFVSCFQRKFMPSSSFIYYLTFDIIARTLYFTQDFTNMIAKFEIHLIDNLAFKRTLTIIQN